MKACAIPTDTAEEVAQAWMEVWVCRYGAPEALPLFPCVWCRTLLTFRHFDGCGYWREGIPIRLR